MSVEFERLDSATLKRLDLPASADSPQGLENIPLVKALSLVYLCNSIERPHRSDIRAATSLPLVGALFTAPVSARRILFSMVITVKTSTTAGTRTIIVERDNKAGLLLQRFDGPRNQATDVTFNYFISSCSGGVSSSSLYVAINFPMVLEPEWSILIDDTANITTTDTVAWEIEYVEVPI